MPVEWHGAGIMRRRRDILEDETVEKLDVN